ncbi:hypothetical protein ACOTJF_28345 [Achromobacter ruhlandii]|uniref:hypothetical protein n=1 Tax=Achromobacter ruhlandii TaxID=72557 RepID=UPI003B9FD821
MQFTIDDKLRAVASFLVTLRDTARCTPDEIKRLLDPRMIDGILAATSKERT